MADVPWGETLARYLNPKLDAEPDLRALLAALPAGVCPAFVAEARARLAALERTFRPLSEFDGQESDGPPFPTVRYERPEQLLQIAAAQETIRLKRRLLDEVLAAPGVAANKALVRRYYEEALNGEDLTVLEAVFAPDTLINGERRGSAAFKEAAEQFRGAFPDLHWTLGELVGEGAWVAVHAVMRGTHHGALTGIPPTGRQVEMLSVATYRVHAGQVVEVWASRDLLGVLQQLGVLAAPAS